MRIPDVYVDQELGQGADTEINGEPLKYLSRVLRKRVGDRVRLFDGSGGWHLFEIAELGRDRARLNYLSFDPATTSPGLRLHLVQGIARTQHMDLILQKSVELGVEEITPVLSQFSNVRLDRQRENNKLRHWQRILVSACEQCGRDRLPRLNPPLGLDAYLADGETGVKLVLAPSSEGRLQQLPVPAGRLNLLIGPEGGLHGDEVQRALDSGWQAVSLGPRVLRTETAAQAALTACQVLWGDMG